MAISLVIGVGVEFVLCFAVSMLGVSSFIASSLVGIANLKLAVFPPCPGRKVCFCGVPKI